MFGILMPFCLLTMQRYYFFCNLSIENRYKLLEISLLLIQINLLCANTGCFYASSHFFIVCGHNGYFLQNCDVTSMKLFSLSFL